MSTPTSLDSWERARRGQHTVVLGLPLAEPPQDLRVVRVSCDVPLTTLGPLLEARSRIERILGTEAPLVEMARSRVLTGLRRHLLGDLPSVTSEGSLVDVCNRFAALGPSALELEAADSADPASLDMLRHILSRPGWLRLPVVLVMRAEPQSAAASALVDAVRAFCGDDAVLGSAPAAEAASPGTEAAVPDPAPAAGAAAAAVLFDLRALPADVLRVLRSVAIAGSGCEAQLLAAMLETSELSVLDALQRAADLGVTIEDRGEGRFYLPEHMIGAFRASILPSLATMLHRRVADTLAKGQVPMLSAVPPLHVEPELSTGEERPGVGNAWEVMQAEPPSTPGPSRQDEAQAAQESAALAAGEARIAAERAMARAAEEAAAAAEQAAATAAEAKAAIHAAKQSMARAIEEDAIAASERAAARAADGEASRAAEEAAARAADEAVSQAVREAASHAADQAMASAAEENAARREAEVAAERAVERAQREIADDGGRAPTYYKPFTGEARPEATAAEHPSRWASARAGETRESVRPRGGAPNEAREPAHARRGAPGEARIDDDARAARHLAAAGDPEAAIERYFEAAQKAAVAAAYPQAVAHAQSALALLERMPPTERRRLQRVQILLQAGRVLWHGAGPDDSFTLPGALRVLESARALLHPGDAADIVADVATTIAGVLYEIGDLASLTRSLDELAIASRALAEAGEPHAAARLFNDQASVYIRLGDPVRAAHLLAESRKIFEEAAKTDPIAMVEMAETDHLFARILLSVPARPGREDDALSMGIDHALAAERAFRRLGAPREVGRVLETMGRLELRKRRLSRAADRITAAVQIQESVGDVMGLAGSTAALSEVLAAGGRMREALSLLGDSIVLHFEKGSPLGLALNRRALQALAEDEAAQRSAADLLREVAARLTSAEKVLGRVTVPGQADPVAAAAR
jgi:chemotaxis protein histidine kinase CheA